MQARAVGGVQRIAWMAGFPKSGTTWLRVLLDNFRSASNEPVSINREGGECSRVTFDRIVGLSSIDLTDDEIDALLPAVYRHWAGQGAATGRQLLITTWSAYRHVRSGEPLFPDGATIGAVYLLRHPLDVAVSWSFYQGHDDFAKAIVQLNDRNGGLSGRTGIELPTRMGDWSSHVDSWNDAPFPVLRIRYEDLLADTVHELGRIARFLRLDGATCRSRLLRAVENSSFPRLREMEAREGYRGRPPHSRTPFFRSGVAGDWRRHLTAAEVRAVVRAHGPTMAAYGYTGEMEDETHD